jgi:ribose transport system ATP-binding protein
VIAEPHGAPHLLSVRGLSKTFPGMKALDNVSLHVRSGEVVAVLGQNGSGKSTLVKVMAGIHRADPGAEIRVRDGSNQEITGADAEQALHFIHQDLGLVPSLSTIENLDLGRQFGRRDLVPVNRSAERRHAETLVRRFGGSFDVRTRLSELQPSDRTIVAIARALSEWAHPQQVLVLDEPTAALHGREVDRLFNAVRMVAAEGAGVIFISHRLDEVFALADRVVVLRDGAVVADREVAGLDEDTLVALIAGREIAPHARSGAVAGESLMTVSALAGDTIKRLDLILGRGEVVGIAGLLGSGRERVADLLFGIARPDAGEVRVGDSLVALGDPRAAIAAGVGLVPAERLAHGTFAEMNVRENLTLPRLWPFRRRLGRVDTSAERHETRSWIRKLDVRPADSEKRIALLSGGNQQKVMLARWLRNDPRVLLLDEPTQGVDVGVKATIYRILRDVAAEGCGVLVVSSDAKELAQVCDRVVVLNDGLVATTLGGAQVTEAAVLGASLSVQQKQQSTAVTHEEKTHV